MWNNIINSICSMVFCDQIEQIRIFINSLVNIEFNFLPLMLCHLPE